MPVKVIWAFLLIMIFASPVRGDSWRTTSYEVYAGIGTSNYFGDIGGSVSDNNWYGIKDINILRSRPGIAGGIRYFPATRIGISGNVALGWLSGSDKGGRNEERDYVFNTILFEPAARIEFFPVRDIALLSGFDRRGMVRNYGTFSAYIFAGAGAVLYHVLPNDNLEARQESDKMEFGKITMVIPAGFGLKIGINSSMDIGLEFGGRYALNDYLDGFTSPSSTSNDIYYMTTITLVFRIPGIGMNVE